MTANGHSIFQSIISISIRFHVCSSSAAFVTQQHFYLSFLLWTTTAVRSKLFAAAARMWLFVAVHEWTLEDSSICSSCCSSRSSCWVSEGVTSGYNQSERLMMFESLSS
ncbi:hypothetical protein CHARACLAT_030072 [Characodon lateralis]|uniref:Secreted protein n=1 Tax=Characodon lateralis TaxID=208331 RepID=A0ABU7CUS2_9TELE|nr:hypothetical protein [Characodon lateralis]